MEISGDVVMVATDYVKYHETPGSSYTYTFLHVEVCGG